MESLVPEPLRSVASVTDFMERLPQYDDDFSSRLAAADSADACLRFVGNFPTPAAQSHALPFSCPTFNSLVVVAASFSLPAPSADEQRSTKGIGMVAKQLVPGEMPV